jgi:hypothetical protein
VIEALLNARGRQGYAFAGGWQRSGGFYLLLCNPSTPIEA